MLKISPHQQNNLQNIRKQESAIALLKYQKSIAPSGPRAQCLDLACSATISPNFLAKLQLKLNKLYKQKIFLTKEVLNIRQKKSINKSELYEVTNLKLIY